VQYLVDDVRCDLALIAQPPKSEQFTRVVRVAVIRPYHDRVRTCVIQYIGQIIVGLAGHVDAICAEDVPL